MKTPSFQFYPGDWLKDPELSMCSPATRGIWIDLLCRMHEREEAGTITGTMLQLARCCRCTEDEMASALEELKSTNAADVTLGHKNVTANSENVTVTCRRMRDAHKVKSQNLERKRRQRAKHECHANVTPSRARLSSSSSSSSDNTPPPPPEKKKPAQPQKEAPFPPALDTPPFRAAWGEWEQHRREIKKPITPLARTKALAQLAPLGADGAVATIEHSIAHDWRGLFPPDGVKPRASPPAPVAEEREDHHCPDCGWTGAPRWRSAPNGRKEPFCGLCGATMKPGLPFEASEELEAAHGQAN